MGMIWQGETDFYEVVNECKQEVNWDKSGTELHEQHVIDMAHDKWDIYYGQYPYSYEVYTLADPRFQGRYEFGPLRFNYKPFYVGHGELGRALKSSAYGRQLDKYTHKIKKMKEIKKAGMRPRIYIVGRFMTKNKAFVVEKKLMNLIPDLSNSLFHLCEIPLLEEDYDALKSIKKLLMVA